MDFCSAALADAAAAHHLFKIHSPLFFIPPSYPTDTEMQLQTPGGHQWLGFGLTPDPQPSTPQTLNRYLIS